MSDVDISRKALDAAIVKVVTNPLVLTPLIETAVALRDRVDECELAVLAAWRRIDELEAPEDYEEEDADE